MVQIVEAVVVTATQGHHFVWSNVEANAVSRALQTLYGVSINYRRLVGLDFLDIHNILLGELEEICS